MSISPPTSIRWAPVSGNCPGSAKARPASAPAISPPDLYRGERMLLAGKKIVVVGGSSGIGLATAEMAKREGAQIIVASRNVERLDKVAEKLNAIAIPADVTNDESVVNLFRACGPVDHVVVTAAQLRTGPFKTVAMDDV